MPGLDPSQCIQVQVDASVPDTGKLITSHVTCSDSAPADSESCCRPRPGSEQYYACSESGPDPRAQPAIRFTDCPSLRCRGGPGCDRDSASAAALAPAAVAVMIRVTQAAGTEAGPVTSRIRLGVTSHGPGLS